VVDGRGAGVPPAVARASCRRTGASRSRDRGRTPARRFSKHSLTPAGRRTHGNRQEVTVAAAARQPGPPALGSAARRCSAEKSRTPRPGSALPDRSIFKAEHSNFVPHGYLRDDFRKRLWRRTNCRPWWGQWPCAPFEFCNPRAGGRLPPVLQLGSWPRP